MRIQTAFSTTFTPRPSGLCSRVGNKTPRSNFPSQCRSTHKRQPPKKSTLAQGAPKRRTLPQILDQIIHIAQVSPQQSLLLLGRFRPLVRPSRSSSGHVSTVPGRILAWTSLQRGRGARAAGGRGPLWHEVEVEELDQLDLDLATCRALFEEGGDGQETVEGLKGTRVGRLVQQGADEDEEGGGLDGGAVGGLEEV